MWKREPKRFKTVETAVEYAHDQWLRLIPLPVNYLPNERWSQLDEEDWAEVTYRMAQLERASEPDEDSVGGWSISVSLTSCEPTASTESATASISRRQVLL